MSAHSTGTTAVALSSSTTTAVAVYRCDHFTSVGGQVSVTNNAGLTANITFQASDDTGVVGTDKYSGSGVTNWTNLTTPASTPLVAAGGTLFDIPFPFTHKWLKVIVTWTAGTGSVVIRLQGKGDVVGAG